MVDKVRPLKIERLATGGGQNNTRPRELDPNEDYVACAGIALANQDNRRYYLDNDELAFEDSISGNHKLKTLKLFQVTLVGDNNPFVDHGTATPKVVSRFIFPGTSVVATPSLIKAILYGSSPDTIGQLVLYDLTNNQNIATIDFQTPTPTIFSVVGSNWPINEAVLEAQLVQPSGPGQARISGFSIIW